MKKEKESKPITDKKEKRSLMRNRDTRRSDNEKGVRERRRRNMETYRNRDKTERDKKRDRKKLC